MKIHYMKICVETQFFKSRKPHFFLPCLLSIGSSCFHTPSSWLSSSSTLHLDSPAPCCGNMNGSERSHSPTACLQHRVSVVTPLHLHWAHRFIYLSIAPESLFILLFIYLVCIWSKQWQAVAFGASSGEAYIEVVSCKTSQWGRKGYRQRAQSPAWRVGRLDCKSVIKRGRNFSLQS